MLRLLLRTSCFEVMLNRRMPNGMYGGVRGGLNSPYSIEILVRIDLTTYVVVKHFCSSVKTVENLCLSAPLPNHTFML